MLPDVERGGASSATKFEHGSWIDAEPRRAPALPSRALDRLSLPRVPLAAKARRGRPRVHASAAARQRAYRVRPRLSQ
jgi:hypothetical protein